MELMPGYKRSDVGVIPDDWDAKPLREVVDFANGKPHEKDIKAGGNYFLITLDSIDISGGLKSQHKETDVWDGSLKKNDLVAVLSDLAHGNLLGLCDLIPQDDRYVLNQRMGRLRQKIDADPLFVRLQINRRQSHFKARGQGTSQRHIYKRDFDALQIPFAPPPEQRVIAAALSDVDALLATLDQVIAKKRDLKQATMQQLLTGEKRLPGFTGDWGLKSFGDLFDFSGGYSASRDQLSNEGHCYLHYGDIHGSSKTSVNTRRDFLDIPKLSISLGRISEGSVLKHGDVVFVDASEDDAGTSKHLVIENEDDVPFISGLHTIVAKSKANDLAHAYKHYCFQTPAIRQQFMFYAVGTKVSGISKTNIAKLTLPIPSIPEQIAIADVLSSMDVELANFEARRDKTRSIKQAMMQELLTGKTRLVEPRGANA